ncbi:MAG: nicotinate phosphoribosyltransferase [Syntrophus sp. (in: bacteria)]|nr:nicotinate phosphoribosyltransferase [Syntrophus sp. (in: bacteria)]
MNALTSPLLTDLYQLTMLQGYIDQGMHEDAVFEFYVRKLPEKRGFLMAAGLETLLAFIEDLQFSAAELQYLKDTGRFSASLIEYLSGFRFNGDIFAMPEGTVFFANEPVVRIVAPMPAAQLIETRLINILHFEILIASKAARCVLAAADRAALVDFGMRRAHGAEAGLLAARATFIAGFAGTSTVLAEPLYGIPIFGTMAHSYIEAHANELEGFLSFARANPQNTTLLIDTYDTCEGAGKAVEAAKRLAREGIRVQAVRLDSGDLLELSREVRRILDHGGFPQIRIFASGNLDEYAIRDLLLRGAPIDGFGVGTKLDTSEDAPYLECAYKLMEYAGKPRFKKSLGKATIPGRKQVFRRFEGRTMIGDVVALEGEDIAGIPLLAPVMTRGRRASARRDLKEITSQAKKQMEALPPHFRNLETIPAYPVEYSNSLLKLRAEVDNPA